MNVFYDFCYIHNPTAFDAITWEGHRPNIAITLGTEKLEWWSIVQVVNVRSVMICLAVSIQYVCVTDGQTDILRQHAIVRTMHTRRAVKTVQNLSVGTCRRNCVSSDKMTTLSH